VPNHPECGLLCKMVKNPSVIKNKVKRTVMYAKYKQQKKKLKKKLREERVAEVEALGEAAPPKQIPKTIDNSRELDETLVQPADEEIAGDEKDDEFAKYFTNELKPKIMITTRPKCSRKLFPFIGDLMQMIPNAFYYPRGKYLIMILSPSSIVNSCPSYVAQESIW
jgi:ribosome production factor 1